MISNKRQYFSRDEFKAIRTLTFALVEIKACFYNQIIVHYNEEQLYMETGGS